MYTKHPLVTETVLGFANFVSTVGNTVFVFRPKNSGKEGFNTYMNYNDSLADADDDEQEEKAHGEDDVGE